MNDKDFQFSFTTPKKPAEVFEYLMDPKNWWVGLFGEIIEGESKKINDEFSFKAGNGVHYSNQKLTELELNKKIVWLVTESNLSFLKHTGEWTGTKISFNIAETPGLTKVTFTHTGLVPEIECYGGCSNAWTQYMENLEAYFN